MRHSVERPAISMEGGKAYGAALPAAVCEAFEKTHRYNDKSAQNIMRGF